jgi:hypothetical protein
MRFVLVRRDPRHLTLTGAHVGGRARFGSGSIGSRDQLARQNPATVSVPSHHRPKPVDQCKSPPLGSAKWRFQPARIYMSSAPPARLNLVLVPHRARMPP